MQEKSVHNARIILSRLKSALNMSKDNGLSTYLGIDKSTLSAWKRRNSIDYELIFTKCIQFNYDWIITGSGQMLRENQPPGQINLVENKPPSPCPNCSALNKSLIATEKALRHAESEITLLIEKISILENAHDGQKRKSA